MYGHEFKELRLEQGITQKEACSGICSESKLSRWENDQVEVEFSTAMKLLNRIHITSHEFMGWSKFSPRPKIDPELSEATEKENIPFLKRVTQKQLTKYHKNHNKFDLFMAANLCNQLFIIEHKNYLPPIDQKKLFAIFSKVNLWSQYYISAFGASIFLFNPKQIYGSSMQIIRNIDRLKEAETSFNLEIIMGSLSDGILRLISLNELSYAQKLVKELKKIELPQYLMFFTLTLTYLQKAIDYMKNGDDKPILTLISEVLDLGCSVQATTYLDMFKYLKAQRKKYNF
jgi:transcriptional activator, rgg/gadR/mutR family, C-terminal domain